MTRSAQIIRETAETKIQLKLELDGSGKSQITTEIGFLDHMLRSLALHGMLDLEISAQGDLSCGDHHLVEDLGIALGLALDRALGDRSGIRRYGFALVPMDDSLAMVALDLGGRSYLDLKLEFSQDKIGNFSTANLEHFLNGLVRNAKITLHLECRGKDDHHKIEALFKALGICLDQAKQLHPKLSGALSTKGLI